mmetsp:Transcript_72349/g.172408  ORF Transcript_72349/g.172408 Transcript_72349/m.172408 type:complete len:111 (-) Transcript_72349:171-503(-)
MAPVGVDVDEQQLATSTPTPTPTPTPEELHQRLSDLSDELRQELHRQRLLSEKLQQQLNQQQAQVDQLRLQFTRQQFRWLSQLARARKGSIKQQLKKNLSTRRSWCRHGK